MFTGIAAAMGSVRRLSRRGDDALIEIETSLELGDVRIGDSIAVSGACLTVTTLSEGGFSADVSAETLSRTTLRHAKAGDRVNLEKALRVGAPLGGHIVLGHVDGVGTIREKKVSSRSIVFSFEVPDEFRRYVVEKGSVAVDGISLTVNRCERNVFYVTIIPHTAASTTLGTKTVSERVNIETDVLARYVEKLISGGNGPGAPRGIDMDMLARHGFIK